MSQPNLDRNLFQCLRSVLDNGLPKVPDSTLMKRFIEEGDTSAFELLVRRHIGTIYRVCRAILRDHHAAEDACQATFLVLARKAASVGDRAAVLGWLSKIAYRISIDALRMRKQPKTNVDLDRVAAEKTEFDPEVESKIHQLIIRLPEKYRLPVLLCHVEGLSHEEAAKRLGWPVGTLHTRMNRAREILRRELARGGVIVPAAGIGALLTANDAFSFGKMVGAIAESAFSRGTSIPTVSSFSIELSQRYLKRIIWIKLKAGMAAVAMCGLLIVAGAGGLGAFSRPSVSPLTDESHPVVLSPIPRTSQSGEEPALDERSIRKFENAGAIYGVFKKGKSESWFEVTTFNRCSHDYQVAEQEIPGISWSTLPESALPEMPQIERDFGISIGNGDVDLKRLIHFKNLHSLELTLGKDPETNFDQIASLKGLKTLIVHGGNVNVTKKIAKSLACLEKLEALHLLFDCADEKANTGVDELAEVTASLKNLKSLTISRNTPGIFKSVVAAKGLESLTLNGSIVIDNIHTDIIKHGEFYKLAELKNLRSLYLSLLSPPTAKVIATLDGFKNLESLELHINDCRDDDLKLWTSLKKLKSLHLYQGQKLSDAGLKHLAACEQLQSFTLQCSELTLEGAKSLSALKELKTLNLNVSSLTDEAIEPLSALKKLSVLNIDVTEGSVSDKGIGPIANLKNLESLRFVLKEGPLTDEGVKALASLENLQELTLDLPNIGNEGIKRLSDLKNLRSISLTSDRLTDDALKALASVKTLNEIEFAGNSRFSLVSIEELKSLKDLWFLSLKTKGDPLSDTDISRLAYFKNLSGLRLDGTTITQAQLKKLSGDLPRCGIRIGADAP